MKLIKIAVVFTALIGLSGIASAQDGGGWEGAKAGWSGSKIDTSQVTVATKTAPTKADATALISDSAIRPCVKIHNNHSAYKVAIGSHTGLTMSNGYVLEVASTTASTVEFYYFTGALYGFGEGSGTVQPSVSILECKNK